MKLILRRLVRRRGAAAFAAMSLLTLPAIGQEYVDRSARFSAIFPGKPLYEAIPIRPGDATMHSYRVVGGPYALLGVAYQDYDPSTFAGKTINDVCKEMADGESQGAGIIRSIAQIQLGRVSGCEVRIDLSPRRLPDTTSPPAGYDLVIRARYFLVKARLYTIIYMGGRDQQDTEAISTLFSTFRILE